VSCAFGRENTMFVESAPMAARTPTHNEHIHTTYSCSKQ
jgi:hypothetical protein